MYPSKLLSKLFVLGSICMSGHTLALTDVQKDELYRHGRITIYNEQGERQGHFEVKGMPGSDNVTGDAKQRWVEAIKLINPVEWGKSVLGGFVGGLTYMKECVYDEGVFAIPSDYRATEEANARLTGHFGANSAALRNWLAFGGTVGGRMALSVWGLVAGGTRAAVAPWMNLVYQPVAAGATCFVAGTAWPVAKYVWNGTAWTLTKDASEPVKGDLTVTWRPERRQPVAAGEQPLAPTVMPFAVDAEP